MSFDTATLRSTTLAAIAAVVLTIAVNLGYGYLFLPLRGTPPAEIKRALWGGASYLVLGFFLAATGAILGGRMAAGWPGKSPPWAGLSLGAGLALVVVVVGWSQGRLDFWLPPNALMAVFGGWLGNWVVERA